MNADYRSSCFYLSDNWNIGLCDDNEQRSLITESVQYLESLLKPSFPDYKVCAFKAGSWGLQPSANLISQLKEAGINIILGVRSDLKIPSQCIDYSEMEEKYLPYYPCTDDITKLAEKDDNMVVIPLQPYEPDIFTFSRYVLNYVMAKFRYKNSTSFYSATPIPDEVKNLAPLKGQQKIKLSAHPYCTHLKIGNQPFSYLKRSFDAVIKRLRQFDQERIPVLIESHTKQYQNYYGEIEKFIAYIAENYESEIEFGEMCCFSKEIYENPDLAISKNGN